MNNMHAAMNKKPQKLLLMAICAVALTACQSNRVFTDYDENADFGTYQQYGWLEARSGTGDAFDPLLAKRVRTAVATELRARGFTEANAGAPDFLVRYYIASSASVSEPNARGSIGMGSFGRNIGMGVSLGFPLGGTRVSRQAQILIDFVDPATDQLTWRGRQEIILRGDDPAEFSSQVQQAVVQILDRFPPQPRN